MEDESKEITCVEDLEPYLGGVVKVLWHPEWGWRFHLLEDHFGKEGPDEEIIVRSTVQVHDRAHSCMKLSRRRFEQGMRVLPAEPEEYKDVVTFSYGKKPPQQ